MRRTPLQLKNAQRWNRVAVGGWDVCDDIAASSVGKCAWSMYLDPRRQLQQVAQIEDDTLEQDLLHNGADRKHQF
jgi:hypothetical protein